MKRSSIGFRLTVWYFAVLGVGLSLFGVGAWLAMRASLHHAVDHTLKDRVQGVKHFMDEQIAALSILEIRDEFREHSVLGPGGDLFQVSDAEGNWLYRSVPLEDNRLSARSPNQLGSAQLYENIVMQGTPIRILSERVEVNGKPYTVQVAASMQEMGQALSRFRWLLLFSVPLLLCLATVGGYLMSRRALAPVDAVTDAARSISIQNLSERLEVPDTGDELERLSHTVNDMLARLEEAVQRMTQFTADASHELRAPTALIRTTAEIALRKERPAEDYKEALREVLTESERMSHLVDSLLMLARADSGAESLALTPVNVTENAAEACAEGRKLAMGKGVVFKAEIPSDGILVQGDAQSLRRLFLILVDNAVKYTAPGGEVVVTLRKDGEFALGVVRDTGIGIAEDDLPHVFTRFWRADKARSRENGGAGLGMSIAKWIADVHAGQLDIQSEPGSGTSIFIRLPLIDAVAVQRQAAVQG